LSRLLFAAVALLLASCGFTLRGDAPTGLKSLYVSNDTPSQVAVEVKRTLATSNTRVVKAASEAEAHLRIIGENREKTIFTITGAGRVYEYQLRLLVTYVVMVPGKETPLIPSTEIDIRRVITYSETAPVAKEAEEALLYRDMVTEATGQVLRRISATRRAGET
jgi:LPS-assembly lipoprotein